MKVPPLLLKHRLLPVVAAVSFAAFHPDAWAGGGRDRVIGAELSFEPVRAPIAVDGELKEWDESKATLLTLGAIGDTNVDFAFREYSAKIAFRSDDEALYLAIWWSDPTPLGPEVSEHNFPGSDGLVLSIPLDRMCHLALWRDPSTKIAQARLAHGRQPLLEGTVLSGVTQGFAATGGKTYTQEVRIPWDALGKRPPIGKLLRMGVELCYGGFDDMRGYRSFLDTVESTGVAQDRWGGNIQWGFMDGFSTPDRSQKSLDPNLGAEVVLAAAGTAAPRNEPVLFLGVEQTRTAKMVAVPARRIEVDGMLEEREWDARSTTTISYEPAVFPGRYEANIGWAYDEQGLYVGVRWLTGGPHFNLNDPTVVDHGYDGGDALQIRLATDRVSHVDAWVFNKGGHTPQPYVNLAYGARFNEGKLKDALSKGAEMKIQPVKEGGYTQELFLPWNLITSNGKPLGEGQSFRTLLDLFFSGREGNRVPFLVNARIPQSNGVVPVPFTAPEEGFYTLVIKDEAGTVVRRLLARSRMVKGQTVSEWDGLNDEGEAVAAGKYQFFGLHHTGISAEYQMTLNNPGNPPWRVADGTGEWGGDHSAPQTVATDDYGVYLGWPAAEDGDGIIGCDLSGGRRWGFFQTPLPTQAGSAYLASDGQAVYFLSDVLIKSKKGAKATAYIQTNITCVDRKTGRRMGFSLSKPYHTLGEFNSSNVSLNWWWDLWREKSFSLDTHAIHDDYYFSERSMGGNAAGIAARGGRIYVSLRISQEIAVYNAADLQEIARWPLPKPAGLSFTKEGALYAISGESVVRLNTETGKPTPVVTKGLDAPVGLALDEKENLYVSNWGATQCVKVFSPKGELLRTIGTQGGRPWVGEFQPGGMLLPRGIAIDKEGKLWVAESDSSPRRVSVWNPETGKLIKDFVGGTNYGATSGVIDPTNPSHVVSQKVLFEIDLTKEGYRPISTIWRRTSKDAVFGVAEKAMADRFVERNGRRYYITSMHGATVIGEWLPNGTWRAMVALGGSPKRQDNAMVVPEEKLLWWQTVFPSALQGHPGENYLWVDLNGDGLVQTEEVKWSKGEGVLGTTWGSGGVDDAFNLYSAGIFPSPSILRMELQGFTPQGVPMYDFAHSRVVVQSKEDFRGIAVGPDGTLYTACPGERRTATFKPNLTAYSPEGRILWKYPMLKDSRPMGAINGESVMGPIDGGKNVGPILSLTQWHGVYVPLITTDGLFIDRLLRDPSEGGKPGPDMYRGETIQHLSRLDDGRIILGHGKNAHHFFEVVGLNTVKRFEGALTVTAEQTRQAAVFLRSTHAKAEAQAPVRITLSKDAPNIDGDLAEWDWSSATIIGGENDVNKGTVALRYDKDHLYVAFKIVKGRPFLNEGQDANQLFLSGDAVDLHFGTDPAADPKRSSPVMGDTRVLLSRLKGNPVAMVYKTEVPGVMDPVVFRSPGRAVSFDTVSLVDSAKVSITDTTDGYVVEAALPLQQIGLEPRGSAPGIWPGRLLRGDVGFIVADSTGRRVARIYRFNRDTQLTADIPTEAALTPKHWGELEADPLPGR